MCLQSIEKPEYTEWKKRICCWIGICSDRHHVRLSHAQSRNISSMNSFARLMLLALTTLTAACTTLSEPEPQLDIQADPVVAETLSEPEAEYENAKQECADEGGEWVWYIHGDGFRHYTYYMSCWDRTNLPSGVGDPRWKEPGLLSYDVYVVYSIRTGKVTGFLRIDPESKENLDDGPDLRKTMWL